MIDGIEYKQCTICKEFKPMNDSYYYKWNYSKDKFSPQCINCQLEYAKVKNSKPEKKQEQSIRFKAWHKKNKKRMNEKCRQWMKDNKEYTKEYYKNWQQSEVGKAWNRIYVKQRAEHKTHNITKQQWEECKIFFDNECAYCGMPYELHKEVFNEDLHKEHVNHLGNNELSNCIPACKICNSEKHTTPLKDWYNKNNPKYSRKKLIKINKWINEEYKKYI